MREVLERHGGPGTIAVDADADLSWSGGLHAGELAALREGLGARWAARFVVRRMLGVEFVATMVPGRLGWYRCLMGAAWRLIGEAFSERVVVPGVSTTEVCVFLALVP